MVFSLKNRIEALVALGNFLTSNDLAIEQAKQLAEIKNPWFTQGHIIISLENINSEFLKSEILETVSKKYNISNHVKNQHVGIIMAGNIPMVGFHDFLTCFLCGIPCKIKLSAKDEALWNAAVTFLHHTFPESKQMVQITERLTDCSAYIATGSSSSNVYFQEYFGKYPHIIRSHRNSIAILKGDETEEDLVQLGHDMHLFFGMGCRNVSKIYVPKDYNFEPLLKASSKFGEFAYHNKYKNNYDYQLAIFIINGQYYMSNENVLLIENQNLSSNISVVNFEYYDNIDSVISTIDMSKVQCVVGKDFTPFGKSQCPSIFDFADNLDSFEFCMKFLN